MKKYTFYFQHDYNASTDVKCLFLRQALGMEGYGIYWFLIEQLANSGGFLPLSITPVLAMQMQVTEIKVQSVICNFNLFTIDTENNFFSRRLNEHLEIRKLFSDSGKRGALNRWNKKENSHPISHPISDGNVNPNAKERKGKEKKEINLNFVLPEFLEPFKLWLKYKSERKEKYKSELSLKQAYNHILKLSDNNAEIAEKIINQSIANNYAGLFELKKTYQKQETEQPLTYIPNFKK